MLNKKVKQLTQQIYNEIEHGECFYDEESLDNLLLALDSLKELVVKLYEENNKED